MNERVLYERRQIGWVTVVAIFSAVAFITVALTRSARTPENTQAYLTIVPFLAVIGALFSSMTVRVTNTYVAWWFGVPAIGRRVAFGEIASVAATKTNIMEGWGIHLTWWHGWVWNIAGFNAVEIRLHSGTRFAVGTPEPNVVVAAIERARSGTMRA